jgi:hypothetical protein
MNDDLGDPDLINLSAMFTFKYANDTSCIVNRNYFSYVESIV